MWWRRLRYMMLLVALCAVATCPSARRSCSSQTRAQEAEQLLTYLADRVEAAVTATGRVPAAPAGPSPAGPRAAEPRSSTDDHEGPKGPRAAEPRSSTDDREGPKGPCCDQGGTCSADAAVWAVPAWKALGFSIDGEHRYQYAYVPSADGRSAVLRATGDLDCDGEPALYELELKLTAGGVERAWTRKQPYE